MDASVEQKRRPAILEQFRNDAACHALLMTVKTGSVGLNLQEADTVITFDRGWNHVRAAPPSQCMGAIPAAPA